MGCTVDCCGPFLLGLTDTHFRLCLYFCVYATLELNGALHVYRLKLEQ